MRSGWWRGSSGVVAGSDRIDTAGQLSKQILGAVAGIFQDDGREILDLDASALATDALHHAVGLVAGRIDTFVLNTDFSNTGKYRSAIQTVTKIPFRQNAGYMAVV